MKKEKQVKIAVVGSINMDMVVTAERIPLKGETVYGNDIMYNPGGKGANQAVAMARLDAKVDMFGCVGADENGRKLLDNLQKNKVGTDFIKVLEDTPTGLAMITVGEQDNTIVIIGGANGKVDTDYVESIKDKLKEYDMVVLQHEIPLETVHKVIDFCNENKIVTVLNPAPAAGVPLELVEKIDFLTPNEHEAGLIFGSDMTCEAMLKSYPEKLVITQGARGVSTCLKNGEILTVPARKSKVIDTTGAGDTLNGAFAVRMAMGDEIEEALIYANTAAGLSVEKMGAQSGMPYADMI